MSYPPIQPSIIQYYQFQVQMILLFYLCLQSLAEFILPDKPNQIVPYRNNQDAFSWYDFFLSFQTMIPSNAELEIIFPEEYDPGKIMLFRDDVMAVYLFSLPSQLDNISNDPCPVEITKSTTTFCPSSATRSGRKVSILFGSTPLNAGSYQVRIKYNQNPSSLGGKSTGSFQLNTKNQGVLIDSNLNFGTLGFAIPYVKHQADAEGQFVNDGSNLGGYVTNYNIVFTTTIDLPVNSWFRAEIAEGFGLSSISCVLVNTNQGLNCRVVGQRIYFGRITAPMPKNTQYKVKLRNVVNPSFSGLTDHFVFETMEPSVNTVIEYYLLNPVYIKPGQIINPSIAGAPLNKNLRIDYTIKFTPMNRIPAPGRIIYNFPPSFQLDPTCRIIQGLSGSTTCTASGTQITIEGFDDFTSQEITLKIFAINPPISKLYTPCTIQTFSKFGKPLSSFKPIDQNMDAGALQISEIESPYFVAIDLYRQMVNLTLSATGPLDFRIYPMPTKQLKLTSSGTDFGSIYIQLPLWWRLSGQTWDAWNVVGQIPTCNFGAEVANSCGYFLQIFRFRTPSTTNYLKYFPDMGLAQCDLPVSLANAIVTPIPGRWDFRVLTFHDAIFADSDTFTTTPVEQDLFTMEIAVDPFPAVTYVRCTSKDQVDEHTVCFGQLVAGLPIPYEGAINLNMSTVNSTYESSSAWPNDLGFGLGNDAYLKIPCTVYINGNMQGYAGTLHPNVVCFAFSGGTTRKYAVLQIRGFSSQLGAGTTVFFVIPDIKSCTAFDMQCFVTLTSAYTINIDEPYTLNILKTSVALVVQGSVSKDVTTAVPGGPNQLQDATLSATFANFVEICRTTTWTFSFTSPSTIQANRDYILIKMPRNRFPYSYTGATSNAGTVYLVDNYRFGQLYYFIICTNTIAAGSPTSVTLGNVRNAIDPTPGVVTYLIYWNDQRRQRVITFPISSNWQDGGMITPTFQVLPKTAWFPANRLEASDMDFDSEIIFQASFQTCHVIGSGGLLELEVQSGLQSSAATCQVWQGVTSPPKGLGYTHECNLVTVSGKNYYHITNFDPIPTLSNIILSYRGKTVISATAMNPITVTSYFNAATRISTPADATNVNDFYNSALNGVLNGIPITGPKRFPIKLQWQPFIDKDQIAREGTRGEFYMHITSTYNIPSYTSNANPRLIFTFDGTGFAFPGGGAQPHCRIDGHLCRYCTWGGSQITMSMPLNIGMTAEVKHLVMISTRGADGSSTVNEGLNFIRAGRYKLRVETSNTGSPVEFIYKLVDVPPRAFRAFWVWSANKIGFDPLPTQDVLATMSVYRVYFNNPTYIPPSNNPNPVKMILKFHRTIFPDFDNGFEGDLGTGLPHRSELPCIHIGFALLPLAEKLKCRLFIGSYPNPAQVIITDFDGINANTNGEIHLPNVFNPNQTYELTKVSLQVEMTDTLTGTIQLLLQNEYALINGTFGRIKEDPTFLTKISIDVLDVNRGLLKTQWPAATNPVFATSDIDTMTTFSVSFGCKDHQMGGGSDMVLFELPPAWELPYGLVTCNFGGAGNVCYGYPSGHYIGFYLDNQVSINTLTTGTINMKTPPFKIIVATTDPPIKIYVFTRSKLVDYWEIPFTQVMNAIPVTPVVTCIDCYYSYITDYRITVTNPKNIPATGAIEIKFPTGLVPRENGCRNSIVEGSELSQTGLICQYDGINSAFVITGFSRFVGPGKIVIRVRMENPINAAAISGQWSFNTWYQYETPFNKLITFGTANNPALSTYTPILFWDTPYRSRVRARTTMYGSIEFRINLENQLNQGAALFVKLPFLKIRCSQWLCLWDETPWYDNHNDNFLTAEKCLFDSATMILSIFTPKGKDITANKIWRVIIDTMNSVDGRRGFEMPAMAVYNFEVYTTLEKTYKPYLVPQLRGFNFFECISLIANSGFKNMFSVQFEPQTNIASTGYLILYIPTQSEEGEFLFDNDLKTNKVNGAFINCYARSGFLATANTNLKCQLTWGNQVLGTPVQIKVTGYSQTLTAGIKYVLEIDEFYNPTVTGDDKHIEMRLESYDAANNLLDQGFSYDFTVKQFPHQSLTLAAPVASLKVLFDTSATFDFTINTNYPLDPQEYYDYYVFEFPEPDYGKAPHAIQTRDGGTTWPSTVSQGHNWVIIRPGSTVSGLKALRFQNYNNPQQLRLTGVVCKGYAVKDRVATAVYTYAAITDFQVSKITSTGNLFLVTPIDYDLLKIPVNAVIRLQITIQIPTTATPLTSTARFNLYAPTGFTFYDNCIPTDTSEMTFTNYDNLLCSVGVGTFNQPPFGSFVGRPMLTFTNMDPMIVGKKLIFVIWVKTPATAVTPTATSPTWNLKAWADQAESIQLFDGEVVTFAVQTYTNFKELSWQVKSPNTLRRNAVAPFEFSFTLKTAATTTSVLTITFPNSVILPTNAVLFCMLENEATGAQYSFQYCTASGTLVITLLFPQFSSNFAINTWFKVSINSRGSASDYGLQFTSTGKFSAALAMGADSGTIDYEVLPSFKFNNANLQIVNQLQSQQTSFLFTFQNTLQIPIDGILVVQFPTKSVDGSVAFFDPTLTGSAITDGSLFTCYSGTAALKIERLDCRIYQGVGQFFVTEIRISNFPDNIPAGTTLDFVIENILMAYQATAGSIPVTLYSADSAGNKLEALVFYDWVSPVSTSTLTLGSMTPTISATGNNVQDATVSFTFNSVNVGTPGVTPYSYIVFRFTPDQFDLNGIVLQTGTTANCLSNGQIIPIANYAIYTQPTQPATACSGVVVFRIGGFKNSYSAIAGQVRITVCHARACIFQGTATTPTPTGALPGAATSTSPIVDNIFPFSNVQLKIEYTINQNLPAGSSVILWHPTTQFTGEKVMLTDGGVTGVRIQRVINGANSEYWVTFKSGYSGTSVKVKFTLFGRLAQSIALAPTIAYKIGFYTRYNAAQVTLDSNFAFIQLIPPLSYTPALDYTGRPNGEMLSIVAIPGISGTVGNDIYIRMPAIGSGSALYKINIYIEEMSLQSSDCQVIWVQTTIPGVPPTCILTATGLVQVKDIPVDGVQNNFYIKISAFKFATSGVKACTAVVLDSGSAVVGVFWGYITLYPQQTFTLSPSFIHSSNYGRNNMLTISYSPPVSVLAYSGLEGDLFVDILDPIVASANRKVLCQMPSSTYVECEFLPKSRLSTSINTDGYKDTLYDRIIIYGFSSQGSSAATVNIWFEETYQTTVLDAPLRNFNFGFYKRGVGNLENYQWGQNFQQSLSTPTSVTTQSVTLNLAGTVQSPQSISTSFTTSYTIFNGDYLLTKLLSGYMIAPGTNNAQKPINNTPEIKIAGGDTVQTYNNLGLFKTTVSTTTSAPTLSFTNFEMPYMPTTALSNPIAWVYVLDSSNTVKGHITVNFGGTVTAATLTSCSAAQINQNVYEVRFQLPNNYVAFNNFDCTPSSCRQGIKISSTSSLSDVKQAEITCGSAVTYQRTPMVNAPLNLEISGTAFRLRGFQRIVHTAPVCIRFRKDTAMTGSQTFAISLVDVNGATETVLASCNAAAITAAAIPQTTLIGTIKSQFGYLDYWDYYSGIVKGGQNQITIQMAALATMSTQGYFEIYTTSLNLGSFQQKNRLKCFFRDKKTELTFYSPTLCTVDSIGLLIKVDYKPPAAANQIATGKLVELVIKYDQQAQPYMDMPSTSADHVFQVTFKNTANTILTTGVFIASVFEKQTRGLLAQTFLDHISQPNNYYILFAASQAISSGSYIQIEFPLNALNLDTTLTARYGKALGTTIQNGYRIDCLDKQGNLGTNYKCNLYYGIDSYQRPFSFIRMTGFSGILSGSNVGISFMNFLNPTVAYMVMDFNIRIGTHAGANYEYTLIRQAQYTLPAISAASSAAGTITVTPLSAASLITYTYAVTTTNALLKSTQATLFLQHNIELWGEDYSLYTATVNGVAAQIYPIDKKSVYVTLPADIAAAATVTLAITGGLKNPVYYLTATNNLKAYIINYQTKFVIQQNTQSTSSTITQTNIATMGATVCNSDLQKNKLTMVTLPFTLLNKLMIGYQIKITFSAGFVLTNGQYCKLYNEVTQVPYLATCTWVSATVQQIIINQLIPTGSQLSIRLQVQLPAPAVTPVTPTYQVDFFADSTTTYPIQTANPNSCPIGTFVYLKAAMPYIKTPQILLQDGEMGPLKLTFKATAAIAVGGATHTNMWSHAIIDNQWLTKTVNMPDTTNRYEVACFWNNNAALSCKQTYSNLNEIKIWLAPTSPVAVNDLVTIHIHFHRKKPIGELDFTYNWHDPVTDLYKTTGIKNVPLVTKNSAGGTIATYTKDVATQNFRFSEGTVLVPFRNYLAVHQGTINTFTSLTIKFKLKRSLLSNTGTDWGQLILKIPTMDDWDNTQPQFPDGIGRFSLNNQEIDCLCVSCPPTYPLLINPYDPIEPVFKCYSYLGAQHRSAPVEIWINPQINLAANDEFEITIAKIKLPSTQYTYGKMTLLAYEYYATTNKFINHTEIVHDFTFQTIPDAFTTYTSVAPPTFSPDMVGEPATVSWVVNNPYQDILDYCHDRWILTTDDAEMKFEHPYNPVTGTLYSNGGLAPYNFVLFTTATNHDVMIFKLAKWISFRPRVVLTKSATQTLQVQRLKNMPYRIPAGVVYKMNLFIDMGVRSLTVFNPKATVPANRVVIQQVVPTAPPCETYQPQTFELKFLPYNKIPKDGKIEFVLPNYDWTYSDNYCQVSSNLLDSGCDIIGATRKLIIKDFLNDYDPNLHGVINVKFDIINPTTPQPDVQFDMYSFWNQNQNWLIDAQDASNNGGKYRNTPAVPIINGGALRVILWDRYQHPYTICGGRTGPLRLRFILRQDNLKYPNDYIRLQMWYAFAPSMPNERIVCYFNDPNDVKLVNIKSHRCDWDNTGGGTLTIYVPEEIDLKINHEWELVISTFGSMGRNGWDVRNPSDLYWVVFSTSGPGDKGWFEAQIPGCPFDSNVFNCENIGWQASDPAGDPSWTIFNFTASTFFNNIPTGDPNVAGHSRFRFDFLTHNEIQQSWPTDLTNRMGAGSERAQLACNGLIKGNNKPLQAQGNQFIECWNIKATGNAWNNTPSYVLGQYYEQIAAGQRFHMQLADFRNGYVVGAFQHIKINIEVKQEDGTFYAQNEHYCWHAPAALRNPPAPAAAIGASLTPQERQVNLLQQRTWFSATVPGDINIGDAIVFDYSFPYTFPIRGFCRQRSVNANYSDAPEMPCVPQHYNHWLVFGVTLQKTNWEALEQGWLFNPPFVFEHSNPDSPTLFDTYNQKSKLRIYVWRGHDLIYNASLPDQSPTTGRAYLRLQTTEAGNPADKYVKYHLGFFIQTTTTTMKHIRIWAPIQYQDIKDCQINRGLILKDMGNPADPITCTISQVVGTPTRWLIEIENYQAYRGDRWFIIDLSIKNPNAQTWVTSWYMKAYESKTNRTYVIDETKSQTAHMWVGESIKPPNLFRAFRNTISFENRRAQTDDFAEVHMRMIPRFGHPATTQNSNTEVQIWLPLAYDLANGGTAVCETSNDYHKDLESVNCQINSNRRISLSTDAQKGLKTECSMIRVTTVNAIGGNGIKLPSTPQTDTFQVFLDSTDASGTIKREYNYNEAYAAPDPITPATDPTFTIKSTVREVNQFTVVSIKFTAPLDIPAGYDTSVGSIDPLSAPPIGTIRVRFNTWDKVNNGFSGFPINLGQTGTNVLCQGFASLKANLQCTLVASPFNSVDYPAIVEVRGFDYISRGDLIEIHFLSIKNGPSYQNDGNVKISSYLTKGDGTNVELIKDSVGYIPLYNPLYYNNLYYLLFTTCPVVADLTIVPNEVGAFMKLTINNFPINTTVSPYTNLGPGDQIVLTFPNYFEFPTESNDALSAVWGAIQMERIVYPASRQVYLTFPTGTPTISTNGVLTLSQLRGPAFAFTVNWNLNIVVLRQQYRRVVCDITGLPPPTPAAPSTSAFSISSQFSGDVFVDYRFTFSPSYSLPAGSTIKIKLPNSGTLNYNHITSSQPAAICSSSNSELLNNCAISSGFLTLTTKKEIPSQTQLGILLSGAKNPSFTGMTSATDYQLIIEHPNGNLINQQNFAPFQFYKSKDVGVIYMRMSNTNNFQTVTAAYTFVMQNSNRLPMNGAIILRMPKEWASVVTTNFQIARLTASWTSQALSYTTSITQDANFYNLRIVNLFVWQQGGSLTLTMLKLTNPAFEWTKVFQLVTQYDSVTIDSTDPLDTSLRFQFRPAVPAMTVEKFEMQPGNTGQISTYQMTMTAFSQLDPGSSIQLQFPSTFPPGLTRFDIDLVCKLTFTNNTVLEYPCSAANQKLTIPLLGKISKDEKFVLSVVGISNPNLDPSAPKGTIDVITADRNNNIITYTSNAAEISPTEAPKTMRLISVSSDSTDLQVKANYTICVQTDKPIPLGAKVFVDFPNQFILRSENYGCHISASHNNQLLPYDNSTVSPECQNSNNLRRIAVTGHTQAYAGDATKPATLCYVIRNIENPSSPGPVDNFVVSIYDTENKNTLYSTFGTLSATNQLTYYQQGLVITVDTIDPISRYLSSPLIKVTLEKSVSHTITLVPKSSEFKFTPAELVFLPANGPVLYFRIQAINDETTKVGQKQFSWQKTESVSPAKFSEMPDSFFQYIDTPISNTLFMTINPKVYRVALGATSLPITLTLSQPAAQDLVATYVTRNPSQDDYVTFNTSKVTFPAGQTVQQLTYTTKQGAISGSIAFTIEGAYGKLYTIVDNIVNFEILQSDDKPPEIVNYYSVRTGRTSMYFRASIDESVTLYYYLALKGNPKPTMDQIKNQTKLTPVFTQFGKNQSYMASVTSDYIYNDVYLDIQGLTEDTDYSLYFFVTDLTGNNNTEVKQFDFKTQAKHKPAQFDITFTNNVDLEKLKSAFGLITGLPASAFQIISQPQKYTIPGEHDQDVKDILGGLPVTYTIQILPNATQGGLSPLEYVRLLQQFSDLLKQEIPEFVEGQNLFHTAKEIFEYPQEFKYDPLLLNYTDRSASFRVALRYTGNLYTLVLPASEPSPTSKQVSMGLNASNLPVKKEWLYQVRFNYSKNTSTDDQSLNAEFTYTLLFDNSDYKAYMTADNNMTTNPDLLKDEEMRIVNFKTKREIVIIPKKYVYSALLSMAAIAIMILF